MNRSSTRDRGRGLDAEDSSNKSTGTRRNWVPFCAFEFPKPFCLVVRVSGLILAGLLCTAAVVTLLEIDITSSVDNKLVRLGLLSPSMDDMLLDHLSVVTIATRGFDSRPLVETLRKQGEFSGDVVVIGDNCSPAPESARIVKVPSERDPLRSKRFKTQVFDLAVPGGGRPVLFVDSDIEVNKPLWTFMAKVYAAEKARGPSQPPCSAWFNMERAWQRHKKGHSWQGGFFYLPSEEASGSFLRAWGDAIDSQEPGTLDQTALTEALKNGFRDIKDEGGGDGTAEDVFEICELPPDMSYVPDFWSRLRGPRTTTFTHFTKSSEIKHVTEGKKSSAVKTLLRGFGSGSGGSGRPPRRVEVPINGAGC